MALYKQDGRATEKEKEIRHPRMTQGYSMSSLKHGFHANLLLVFNISMVLQCKIRKVIQKMQTEFCHVANLLRWAAQA